MNALLPTSLTAVVRAIQQLAMRSRYSTWIFFLFLSSLFCIEQSFYIPGVAPVEFKEGDLIDVKVCGIVLIVALDRCAAVSIIFSLLTCKI